ncbi:MAG: hypothetical protein HYT03_02795 [Candidatus Harrisonbacteria bacterium]|nr:hypothetical protein [Candidatus Harrisonbacteria bacterium]
MAKIFKKTYDVKLPKARSEVEEFYAKKGILICSDCGAVYWKKHWHHGLEKLNKSETISISEFKKEKNLRFLPCPACQMIKNHQYEGRITIKNFPSNSVAKLEELVSGFGDRAYDRDPMDRVIKVEKVSGNWVITTTENELANKLARKIKSVFSKLKSRVKFAPEPSDVAEIIIEFS